MATYTENYNLKKPTYEEPANIKDINENMDKVDEVMHSTQVSLAPAYDLTATYNTGDIVMHELLMYKCKEDNVTGAWDPAKWERTTAVEGSGGGADLDIYGEASGTAEASFSDGAEASLVECEIGIVPTQDLHGYSKPWAGGANYNKWDEEWEVGYIDSQGNNTPSNVNIRSKNYIPIEPNTSYYLKSGYTTVVDCPLFFYDENKVFLSSNLQQIWNTVITTPPNARYIRFYMNSAYGDVYNNDIGINYPSTVTDYSPYANICPISGHTDVTVTVASTSGGSGEDTTVSLGRTVYSGTLDVTTGELTVDKADVNLSQQTLSYTKFTTGTSDRFYVRLRNYISNVMIDGFNDIKSDYFDAKMQSTNEVGTTYMENGYLNMNMTIGQFADATAFKTWIESESVNLVYELATPQTFTLTPTQVLTLLGQNYVSHDGGGTISLVYIKGDAPIKPNPADAKIPLTGLEINGEKFSIPSGANYKTDVLLDETNGVTVGVTYGFLNNHTLDEYDAIEIIVATRENVSGGLGYDHWFMTVRSLLDFPIINYGAYDQRWFYATFTNNSVIQNNSSGDQYPYIYRIYGIKY